ncbi:ATP-binding protein [Achromobacter denitrificans]
MDYAIYLLDIRGRVSTWNSGAERFKGYRAEEIIGKHFSVFYTEEDKAAGVPLLALETAKREGRFEAEGWRVRKDGSRFWCSVIIDAIHDAQGVLVGFAKITRDITAQKAQRESLQAARDAMHHAHRMEAIGRLTGGVAHDFNNFLTAIRFSAEFLRNSRDLPPSLLRYVDIISDTTGKAAQLTHQLLAYAKRQPLQPHVVEVRDILSSLRRLFEATLGSSIALTYEFGPGSCRIYADPGQLESALLNLVINARDAMPSGGKLLVSVRCVDGVPASPNAEAIEGSHVAVSVCDTGTGIDPDVLPHVFEPFFSTKGPHENSGLGLSQVQGFAQQSGGDVRVRSDMESGTEFTLFLPAVDEPEVPRDPGSREGSGIRDLGFRHNILLVEDNRMVGEVVSALLRELGQNPSWATDARAALRLLENAKDGYDIAILDVVLPGMNGVELAHEIRARWPRVHLVLATGYSDALAGADVSAFPVMRKPYTIEALVKLVHERSESTR